MIKITNFSYSFPEKDLYENVSFSIDTGKSCAFIGSSGCGKSTLADIILDQEKYMYDGKIELEEECTIGYISQFYDLDKSLDLSVFEYIAQDFIAKEKEIADICDQMGTTQDLDFVMEKYQNAVDAFSAIDGDNYESNINKKLNLADLMKRKDLSVLKLSGGEYKLVQVIKQMLNNPKFVIMDEPDSFLDFENLNSLKNLINNYKGTMLTITHSRYLLNHCFNKIVHLENKEIQEFDGNYIDYNFALLAQKVETQELAIKDEEEIARNESIIERSRFIAENYSSPSNGRALRARVKIQERLLNRQIKNPFINIQKPKIEFSAEDVIENETILTVENLKLGFSDLLVDDVNFEIKSTDKVAIIGANGTGKTTLIREIFKNNNPTITFADFVNTSYLSQNQDENFKEEDSIFDIFFDAGFKSYDEITEYLNDFGFHNLERQSKKLSGGEKNILGLAKISHDKANFLILDEPTSHLDTYGQIALEEAISAYTGGILMISHDFYTIANCMDYLLIIEDKTVRKMQLRKFRKIIYAKHFSKEYLELEQNKKLVETKIESALSKRNYELAKDLLEELAQIISQMA